MKWKLSRVNIPKKALNVNKKGVIFEKITPFYT